MILIDTGPLVALVDPHDQNYRRAVAEGEQLVAVPLLLTLPVLTEAHFHLRSPRQRLRLAGVLDRLDLTIADVDPTTLDEVFRWLGRYATHQPDFADACLAVLSGGDRRLKVWTHDAEFETIWRRPDGSPIPLAFPVSSV